jgi:2-methylisocitrate lyase-like PEP mutase family enzyme
MDGAAKTTVMLGVCTSGAANLADAYSVTVNGVVYGDWFLPSKGELNQMYVNRVVIGGFAFGYYWSSSEGAASTAWDQHFLDGAQDNGSKALTDNYVRPVRAF